MPLNPGLVNMQDKNKKSKNKKQRNGFSYTFINTKYGKRILIVQGDSKIWLREEDLKALLSEILERAFKYNPGKNAPYD